MSKREPSAIVQLKVRMRESMRDEIEKAAKEAGHSMNAEIIRRLEAWWDHENLEKRWDAIAKQSDAAMAETKQMEKEFREFLKAVKASPLGPLLEKEPEEKS